MPEVIKLSRCCSIARHVVPFVQVAEKLAADENLCGIINSSLEAHPSQKRVDIEQFAALANKVLDSESRIKDEKFKDCLRQEPLHRWNDLFQ